MPDEIRQGAGGWTAKGLRATVFPRTPQGAMKLDVWEEVVGTEPESYSKTPHATESQGKYGTRQLVITKHLDRVQFEFVSELSLEADDSLVALTELPEMANQMGSLVASFTKLEIPIFRLGLGALLMEHANSHEEAYAILGGHLPSICIDPSSRDFLYRINRRRQSVVVPGIEINRLCTWGVTRVAVQTTPQETLVNEFYCPRLDLDINTATLQDTILPSHQIGDIWAELLACAIEIAREGDIA